MNRANKLFFLSLLLFFVSVAASAQQITQGRITYERRTNLYKKFKDESIADWIPKTEKNKIDVFELVFNDSLSLFREKASDVNDRMNWFTEKNTVYQDLKKGTRLTIKPIWGEPIYISDSLYQRTWKITDSKRTICGYTCRKAVWQPNDSTRIYAWYCNEISTGTGPESFIGLPGAILGLATEDGGVIYFATRIETITPDASSLLPKKTRDKIYTSSELKAKLVKEYGKEKWGKAMIRNTFGYW